MALLFAVGSTCFLVAGALAYVEVAGGLVRPPPHTIEGTIVAVNALGALAFLVGAVLLLPEHAESRSADL